MKGIALIITSVICWILSFSLGASAIYLKYFQIQVNQNG